MAYRIIVSPLAQREIENAIEFYALYSENAPIKFISVLQQAYVTLETNPYFRIRYKNIRALKIEGFPFSLFFIIHEESNTIRVLSCFHNKRDPNKRPRIWRLMNILSVTNVKDFYWKNIIKNFINDAVIAHSNAVSISAF